MWLNKLKIAVVQKDVELLDKLLNDIPKFENINDIQEAQYLLKEATSVVKKLKEKTAFSMQQIKKTMDFLDATKTSTNSSFEVIS